MRLAVIDIGTNTVRLLVGERSSDGSYQSVVELQRITRLGQNLLPEGTLKPEPMRRTLATLAEYAALARTAGAHRVAAVGTSAIREAKNRDEFVAAVQGLGVDPRVISGEEEARLTLLGIRAALPHLPERILLLDIGGGSTELLLARGDEIEGAVSARVGSVRLTEAWLTADPPSAKELARLRAAAAEALRSELFRLPDIPGDACLVGTAGTITTLAAIELRLATYDPSRVNGYRLSTEQIQHLLSTLTAMPLERRRRTPGLEPGRADIIVAGAAICLQAMEELGFEELLVSDGGLREGILLDLLGEAAASPRES